MPNGFAALFDGLAGAPDVGDRGVGVHLLLGDDFRPMFRNLLRNLEERRVQVVLAAMRNGRSEPLAGRS